jgi:hypothetical protein
LIQDEKIYKKSWGFFPETIKIMKSAEISFTLRSLGNGGKFQIQAVMEIGV